MLKFELIKPKSHPIISKDYIVPTPALEGLLEMVLDWVKNLYTGSIIYGYQRLGKTTSVEYIAEEIRQIFGHNVMVGIAPMVSNIRISESAFWGQILKALGHEFWSRGSAIAKRDRLIKYFQIFNQNNGGEGRAVLFIDDAQKMEESHFDWISELHNDLNLQKFHLAVFLVGQPELLGRKATLEENHKYEIVARFMNEEHQFHGIRNDDDIAVILHTYDENTEYPQASGCSFTKYFFPDAFEYGWRFEDETDKVWNEILKARNSHGLKEEVLIDEIHMEYFARIIERLCTRYQTNDPGFNGFSTKQIEEAIHKSDYLGGSKYLRYKDILPRPEARK